MCKKQTAVSHSFTESVTSLDVALRKDGISVLDSWDLVIEVSHSSPNGDLAQGDLLRTGCEAHPQDERNPNVSHRKDLV